MNSRERFLAICRGQPYDRLYRGEFGYWCSTLQRWYKEGLRVIDNAPQQLASGRCLAAEFIPFRYGYPKEWSPGMRDREVSSLLGFDEPYEVVPVYWEMLPPFEYEVIEEMENKMIFRDWRGVVQEQFKEYGSLPRYISFPVKNRKDFDAIAERFRTDNFAERYPLWWDLWKEQNKNRTRPVGLSTYPYGIFSCLREIMGFENCMITLASDPDFIDAMLEHFTNYIIALWDDVLNQVDVDYVHIWEDMAYKSGPLISPQHFAKYMLPCYKKVTSFLRDHGIDIIQVDSDGKIDELIPLWIEGGVNYLVPMEVAAGMDVCRVREQYPELVIGGGIDKRELAQGKEAIDKELARIEPMLARGRYFPHVDHAVDPNVSWENFLYYRKKLDSLIEKHGAETQL